MKDIDSQKVAKLSQASSLMTLRRRTSNTKNEIGTILMKWENAESDLQSEKARGFYSARAVRKVSVGK